VVTIVGLGTEEITVVVTYRARPNGEPITTIAGCVPLAAKMVIVTSPVTSVPVGLYGIVVVTKDSEDAGMPTTTIPGSVPEGWMVDRGIGVV